MTWKPHEMRPDDIFTFGKHKGKDLFTAYFIDRGWVDWSVNNKLITITVDDYLLMCGKMSDYYTIKTEINRIQHNIKPKKRKEKVYFISDGNGHIKVGHTFDVKDRLRVLQTSNAGILKVVKIINGDTAKEKEFHKRLKHLKVRGEWFKDCDELWDAVKEIQNNT